jgi:hypothetical protein
MWIRLGDKAPIQLAAKRHRPMVRIRDEIRLIGPTGLEQQHVRLEIRRKSRRDHAACGTGTAHDVVEPCPEVRRELLLVCTDAPCEVLPLTVRHDVDSLPIGSLCQVAPRSIGLVTSP